MIEMEPISEEPQCETCGKKKEACVSFLSHENAMMHKDLDNERMHKTILFVCLTFLLIVIIFVAAYTIRMASFLDTIKAMNAALVELANAKAMPTP